MWNITSLFLSSYPGKGCLPLCWFFMHQIALTHTINKLAAEDRVDAALLSSWQRGNIMSNEKLLWNRLFTIFCLSPGDNCFSIFHKHMSFCLYYRMQSAHDYWASAMCEARLVALEYPKTNKIQHILKASGGLQPYSSSWHNWGSLRKVKYSTP